MRVIIAGSRGVTGSGVVQLAMDNFAMSHPKGYDAITEVVCGGARGADELGKKWAEFRGIPVKVFPADWDRLGKAAGCLRNRQMAQYADALVLLWDGESPGSRNMLKEAHQHGLLVHVTLVNK